MNPILSSSQPKSVDIPQGSGRISPRVTICSLPDEVLLDIFEFCLPDRWYLRAISWSKFVHVCQRWRYIIFASPLRLDLRLLCTDRTPVRKMLDIWPPLPIEIGYSPIDPQAEDNIIAALEHRNRVRRIWFGRIWTSLERLVPVMEEPFPELESLYLQGERTVLVLPNTFLGGSAPRIRLLHLEAIPFPTLPRLLLSCNDLVNLSLLKIPQNGYISPEAMATCVSALISLTNLSIDFESPASRPDTTTRHPPPLTRAVLPALTDFNFCGVSEYLEDFMAQIDAPLLHTTQIRFFNQLVSDIQQLRRFIGHAPALMLGDTASIFIHGDFVQIDFSIRDRVFLSFEILCEGVDRQVSSVAQICNQFLGSSSIRALYIHEKDDMPPSTLEDVMDEAQWLELFRPFTALQALYISRNIQSHVVSALRGLSGETAMEVLPALDRLYLEEYQVTGPEQPDIEAFIIARQRSGHPVSIYDGCYYPMYSAQNSGGTSGSSSGDE
ncbi:hypothetical protein BGW80DRAFT_182649 [Lactifluus volemus]|nr:hypothetical protein BGW80DRAFT_182649 [Lactifluus volemus]